MVRPIVRLIAPQALRPGPDGRLLLWQPLSAILAMALLGCYPRQPWVLGGGWADAVAVVGERYRDMIAAEGVTVSKIHVTGHPRHDRTITDGVRWRGPERKTIRREIGVPKDNRLVVLAAPPVAHILQGTRAGHIAPETMAGYLRKVVAELLALGGDVHLAVKIHPRDADLPLSWLDGHDWEFSVVRAEMEAARLIGAAHLLVCQGSSVVFDAHLLDVPAVTFDFFRTPGYDMWAKAGGVLHVTEPAAFSETVRRALDDPETRERLAAERKIFRRTHLRDDGKATERIVGLILDRMGR
jgi:CDP-glycerol glycerophosphotransferase (TagB/SpsB family)